MIIETFITSPFQQNTRVLACEETRLAVCIDPGDASPEIAEYIKDNSFQLQAITITHAHLDHIGGVADLHKHFPNAEILLHKDDEALYYGLPEQPLFMGFAPHQLKDLGLDFDAPPPLTRNWRDGEIYAVGTLNFKIRHAPGHAPGHIILVEETERKMFSGDCLFAGSIGRTNLPGDSFEQLIKSINDIILPFGDDCAVYTGHGDDTTIGQERTSNPFLTGVL